MQLGTAYGWTASVLNLIWPFKCLCCVNTWHKTVSASIIHLAFAGAVASLYTRTLSLQRSRLRLTGTVWGSDCREAYYFCEHSAKVGHRHTDGLTHGLKHALVGRTRSNVHRSNADDNLGPCTPGTRAISGSTSQSRIHAISLVHVQRVFDHEDDAQWVFQSGKIFGPVRAVTWGQYGQG